MWQSFLHLLKKDLRLMCSGRFFVLAFASLILYSCYINFVYVKVDQPMYPVYVYDPQGVSGGASAYITRVESRAELEAACRDGYSVGADFSSGEPRLYMCTSGTDTLDHCRISWAGAVLSDNAGGEAVRIGGNSREMKNRREITAEFLFFELAAIGFLGLASILFKEKQMGVIRVHGVLPVSRSLFIVSKLLVFLLSDLVFAVLLTLCNLGLQSGAAVLPGVLVQAGILSLIMALVGFLCAVLLPDFRQFSLFYLVLAVFVTSPVFLAEQAGLAWDWIVYHPMYHLFAAMKAAYFANPLTKLPYYAVCAGGIAVLFLLARRTLSAEIAKEG